MIKAIFFTCSLKQCARLDPKGGGGGEVTERTFAHPICLYLLCSCNSDGVKIECWSDFSFLLDDAHNGFSVQVDSDFALKK